MQPSRNPAPVTEALCCPRCGGPLVGADGGMMLEGWDVTFGNGNVFANLEYGIHEREVVQAKLLVRTKAGAASTELQLYLFEPYE